MDIRKSGLLGGDEFVDLGAQVLQHEIFLGRNLAVIDFLRPLFERDLDTEGLVDGKNDVEEVKAIDAEIINRVAFRRDGIAVDFTGFSDDIGDLVEC